MWPMYIHKGGTLYNFCPGKIQKDPAITQLFKELVLISELKMLPYGGNLWDQPYKLLEMLSWFIPIYDTMKFTSRIAMMFGSDDSAQVKQTAARSRSKGR